MGLLSSLAHPEEVVALLKFKFGGCETVMPKCDFVSIQLFRREGGVALLSKGIDFPSQPNFGANQPYDIRDVLGPTSYHLMIFSCLVYLTANTIYANNINLNALSLSLCRSYL